MLPQEMDVSLPTELSNLWMIADDIVTHVKHLLLLLTRISYIKLDRRCGFYGKIASKALCAISLLGLSGGTPNGR